MKTGAGFATVASMGLLCAGMSSVAIPTGAQSTTPSATPAARPGGPEAAPSAAEVMDAFTRSSTGNVADAVDEATGVRGFMSADMKPVFKAKVIGPAVTVLLR